MTQTSLPQPAAFAQALKFPKGFLWGTASSSYQVEGANKEDGRTFSIWDKFARTPGKVVRGDNCDISIDEYHRLDENLDMMAEFGMTAYRFSIAWPRVIPNGSGQVNQIGIDYYKRVIAGCHKRGITPIVTIFHWDMPQTIEDAGGWRVRQTSEIFAEYCATVYKHLAADVPQFITINEPWCAAWLGYGAGIHAPGATNVVDALKASHHLLLGHGLAVDAMRAATSSRAQIGIAPNLFPIIPWTNSAADAAAAKRVDGVANRLFLDPVFHGTYPEDVREWFSKETDFGFIRDGDLKQIARPMDFLGLNYYRCYNVADKQVGPLQHGFPGLDVSINIPEGTATTVQGWPIQPEGLTAILLRLKKEYTGDMPILITENGCSANDYIDPEGKVKDDERITFWSGHIKAIGDAVAQGIPVTGYTPWSFFDCYEWAEGFSRRFGLVYVDYKTQERTPKKSAYWYRDFIKAVNGS
jgi:beta-glucosidase